MPVVAVLIAIFADVHANRPVSAQIAAEAKCTVTVERWDESAHS